MLPLRGFIIYPKMIMNFDVGRKSSIRAIEKAMIEDEKILLTVQKDAKEEKPEAEAISSIGTVATIKQVLKLPSGVIRVMVEANHRGVITGYEHEKPYFLAEIEEYKDTYDAVEGEALVRQATDVFDKYGEINQHVSPDTILNILSTEHPGEMADLMAGNISFAFEKKLELLLTLDPIERLEKLIVMLAEESSIIKIQKEIQRKVKRKVDDTQKEYYLKEQLKIIQDTLNKKNGVETEEDGFMARLEALNLEEETHNKLAKEIDRLEGIPNSSPESSVVRNYIETVLDLPWNEETKETIDIKKAETILDQDHYGMKKVKERILEHLAVRAFAPDTYSPILCLVGPPGVGKTSIAASIAKALNRKYVRISLGGVRDEAEIRGHRKTYLGAMPGRIMTALSQGKSHNPLMLLDEIDKMSADLRGDPTAALLEVLDPEQNRHFRDHFVEVPYDLSKTLFFATANNLQNIPRPLLDRMEIIDVNSYTENEKTMIARNHLYPKQLAKHGLKKSQIKVKPTVFNKVINEYTKEAGVRNLERKLAELIRKSAKELLSGEKKSLTISEKRAEELLGMPIYSFDLINEEAEVGIARGLAWTSVGGDTLSIEVNTMPGSGKFQLTGQLGDVMKESAETAMSYVRSKHKEFGLEPKFHKELDIHIHIPEGAVPKDGPSAGITMATAMISALTDRPVRHDLGMTGEITLRGRVLPIGGLKEKLLAAKRAGINKVIVPVKNSKNISDLETSVTDGLEIVFATKMDEVLEHAFLCDETINREGE